MAPCCTARPSPKRISGPNAISPLTASHVKWASSGPEPEKSGTSTHWSEAPVVATITVSSPLRGSTGVRRTRNRWSGVPSLRPRASGATGSAWWAVIVPPRPTTVSAEIFGESRYPGWSAVGAVIRQRSQNARVGPTVRASWPVGMISTMSPSTLRPPVPSRWMRAGAHSCPSQASHAHGGCRGSTPTPSTLALSSSRMMLCGSPSSNPK